MYGKYAGYAPGLTKKLTSEAVFLKFQDYQSIFYALKRQG
jgi:hypothetical protein